MGTRRMPVSRIRIKYSYLWFAVILSLLASIGILSSLTQSRFSAKTSRIAEIEARNPLPENPVYSPLAQSAHFRNVPSSPERPSPAHSLTPMEPGFSWTGWSESRWWVPEDQDLSSEFNWLRESYREASEGRTSYQDLLPRLRSRDVDPQVVMSNYITMGVADLLDDLNEQEVEGVLAQDAPEINPFERAFEETIDEGKDPASEPEVKSEKAEEGAETAPANPEPPDPEQSEPEQLEPESPESESLDSESLDSEQAEPESPDSEQAEPESPDSESPDNEADSIDEPSGGPGSPKDCSLLFIGSFDGQPLATAFGTVKADLLHQWRNKTVFIELEGSGKQDLDIDVVLRNSDNQESVAFGDLDNDGFIDMVVTNKSVRRAHIFKNDGQGNYYDSGKITGIGEPAAAVISDFNLDGSADVAVGNSVDRKIVVDGKGLKWILFLPTSYVAEEFSSMTPYDFDGDGLMDLLLSNYETLTSSVYLNQGRGRFAESDSFALQEFPYLQSRIDLDADGIEDVVYIQGLGDNISVVIMNGSNGEISNLGNMTLDPSLYFLVGDFNLDGTVDIALAYRR